MGGLDRFAEIVIMIDDVHDYSAIDISITRFGDHTGRYYENVSPRQYHRMLRFVEHHGFKKMSEGLIDVFHWQPQALTEKQARDLRNYKRVMSVASEFPFGIDEMCKDFEYEPEEQYDEE